MEDDDGRESFEINDMDLEYAMNPGGRRRFQNKDQATYGGVRSLKNANFLRKFFVFLEAPPFLLTLGKQN